MRVISKKDQVWKGLLIPSIASLGVVVGSNALAYDYPMGNFDLNGSHAIPDHTENQLTIANVKNQGLEVKWFVPTDLPAISIPIVSGNLVYIGTSQGSDSSIPGSLYAVKKHTGKVKWKLDVPGGVYGAPLVVGNHLYVGGFDGTLYKLNKKNGKIIWTFNSPNPDPLDTLTAGVINIQTGEKDLIIFAINPGDEGTGITEPGKSRVIAVDTNGTLVWEQRLTPDTEGGSGVWELSPSYSKKLNRIFVTTGQTPPTDSLVNPPQNSTSVLALDGSTGTIVDRNNVNITPDIWDFETPFDPDDMVDMDIGDGAALFTANGIEYVAMGSKRGIFYVMEAGNLQNIVNDNGIIGRHKKGLDFFNWNGVGAIGADGVGGYNLDSGYYRNSDGDINHFGTVLDAKENLTKVFNQEAPWDGMNDDGVPAGICFFSFANKFDNAYDCLSPNRSHLVIMNQDATSQLGSIAYEGAFVFAPLYVNNMVIARVNPFNFAPPGSVVVYDVSDPGNISLIEEVTVTPTTGSYGASLSVSDGMIFTGNGFFGFGEEQGLYAIGLKADQDDDDSHNDDE